ncbi:MAG: hypothetical protein ACJ751_19355 [Niastella sp.]
MARGADFSKQIPAKFVITPDRLMFEEQNYTPSPFTLLGDGDVTRMKI